MARQPLHDMSLAVREAFADACARHGFVWEDFEVNADDTAVSVERVAGGELRRYAVDGVGTPWTIAFERDLEGDVFGPPLAD